MNKWYLPVLTEHYADFKGRARRQTFWMFFLWNFIVAFVIGVVAMLTGIKWLSSIYSLAVLVPYIGIGVRRLHDTGRSGLWWLIGLVPLVGWIVLLIFWCQDSQPGANKWGTNPKA